MLEVAHDVRIDPGIPKPVPVRLTKVLPKGTQAIITMNPNIIRLLGLRLLTGVVVVETPIKELELLVENTGNAPVFLYEKGVLADLTVIKQPMLIKKKEDK